MFPFHNTEHFVPLYTAIKVHRNSTQTYKIVLTNFFFFFSSFKYIFLYPGTVPNHSKIVSVKCIQSYLQRNIWSKCLKNPDYVFQRVIYTMFYKCCNSTFSYRAFLTQKDTRSFIIMCLREIMFIRKTERKKETYILKTWPSKICIFI